MYNKNINQPESPLDLEAILTECALALDLDASVVATCVKRWGIATVAVLFGHRFALRSAEVLALTNKDVSLAGICMVQAVKIIMPWHFINQAYTNPSNQTFKLFGANYQRMCGASLDLDLANRPDRYVNRRVTHADRHALADQLAYMGIEV